VHAGENGFLARPGRAADVAGSLDLLCRDGGLRARMSKSGLRIVADHDRHRLLARWESIYSALAARACDIHEKDRQR
jgi:glycosyltransferase involved in cell wall biosynthesis